MKSIILFFALACIHVVKGESRIAGGDAVGIISYPFAASLLTNGGAGDAWAHACGGTVLTASAILSAASCFYTNDTADEAAWWRARVGSPLSTSGGTVHPVSRITVHAQFAPAALAHDLAVLRPTSALALQAGVVQAAFIAGASYSLTTNQPIWAIGWGATSSTSAASEQLRHVQFWVVDQTLCASRYSQLGVTVTEDMVCTGWLDVGIRAQCQGDAGSPLVDNGVVVGVHSWAEGCADEMYPGVNTRIAPYTRWIVEAALEP